MSIDKVISDTKWKDLWNGAVTYKITMKVLIAMYYY